MSFSNVGKVWTRDSFHRYLSGLKRPEWIKGVTLHHTGAPSLATRPRGFAAQHIENIANYYKGELGWKSGPHLFIDDDQCFGMTPLTERGVHARSFNATHIGIEVLGEYDTESPFEGRGLACWTMTAGITAAILEWLGADVGAVDFKRPLLTFHRDDPKTSKTCAGRKIEKEWFVELMRSAQSSPLGMAPEQIFEEKFVPALDWLQSKGRLLIPRMTKVGLMLGDYRVERHYYEKSEQRTYIALRELEAWLASA
jgi:hypothetical protein